MTSTSNNPRSLNGDHSLPANATETLKTTHQKIHTSLQSITATSEGNPPGGDSEKSIAAPEKSEVSVSSPAAYTVKTCAECNKVIERTQFVRALGQIFHMECFNCMTCGKSIASKFFPVTSEDGRERALCERDYFRRLNLLCAKCDMALRGSYITACNKKYHLDHFTCSLCPFLFGKDDSYYEHEDEVYCYHHYSTRYAQRCTGCNDPILTQFVETNRGGMDRCWHPECFMIHKFWNFKINLQPHTDNDEIPLVEREEAEPAITLKTKRAQREQKVYRVWTVLSAFEESSAATISDMLRNISNGVYLNAIREAERFILHVEVLFATIFDLQLCCATLAVKGPTHVREARMLCRKAVDLFVLISHGGKSSGLAQELLATITGLAHYLKVLIRIALATSVKLERNHDQSEVVDSFLDKLHSVMVHEGNPSARRLVNNVEGREPHSAMTTTANSPTHGVSYGFRSLAPENGWKPLFSLNGEDAKVTLALHPPTDLCVHCRETVEEECVRLGAYQRWHSHCLKCSVCAKAAGSPPSAKVKAVDGSDVKDSTDADRADPPAQKSIQKPKPNVGNFVFKTGSKTGLGEVPTEIFCVEHSPPQGCKKGFEGVERLEQYAYLLNIALHRLYLLLVKRGIIVSVSPAPADDSISPHSKHELRLGDLNRHSLPPTPAKDTSFTMPLRRNQPDLIDVPNQPNSTPSQRLLDIPHGAGIPQREEPPTLHVRSLSDQGIGNLGRVLEDDEASLVPSLRPSLREFLFVSRLIEPIGESTKRLRRFLR